MYLEQLSLFNYRNIKNAEIEFNREITLFHGLNGQGKTNILESIYLLGNARPFRASKIHELIKHDQKAARISGKIESSVIKNEISINIEANLRKISIDGKPIQRAAELYGKLAVIVFSPDDTAMIKLGPESRRRYLDRALYTREAGFLKNYHEYYKTLKQRNMLLKQGKHPALSEWNRQLAIYGQLLMSHRKAFIELLNPLLQKHYKMISGAKETVKILYRPDIEEQKHSAENIELIFSENQETDIKYGNTSRGPHKDDLVFLIDGRPLKSFGSQGQQRSYVLALKMAEMDCLEERFGEPPVLLLDDMASELDKARISNLLEFITKQNVQTMITTTDKNSVDKQIMTKCSTYLVKEGTLQYEGNSQP